MCHLVQQRVASRFKVGKLLSGLTPTIVASARILLELLRVEVLLSLWGSEKVWTDEDHWNCTARLRCSIGDRQARETDQLILKAIAWKPNSAVEKG